MNNGCVCCTVRGDLIRTLNKLLKRSNKFDAIVIETTGLADPAPVIQTFFVDDDIKEGCQLDAILTVVDTKHLLQHLDEVKPADVVNEAAQQVRAAPPCQAALRVSILSRLRHFTRGRSPLLGGRVPLRPWLLLGVCAGGRRLRPSLTCTPPSLCPRNQPLF